MENNQKMLIVALGVLAIAWPFVYDQVKLSCLLSPQACSSAEPAAFYIILVSIIIGSSCISLALLGKKWRALIVTLLIGAVAFGIYFSVSFSRNFHF